MAKVRFVVTTGYANCAHEEIHNIPTDDMDEDYLDALATDILYDHCDAYWEVLEDD